MFAIILLALAQLCDAHTGHGPFIINDQLSRQQVRSNVAYVDKHNIRDEMILSYFSQCSGVSIDSSSCIENEFFHLFNIDEIIHQMHETFDCTPPSLIEPTYINNLILSAIESCKDEDVSLSSIELEKSIERLNALVGSVSCWKSLCYDDSFITIASSWLETCANIEFPTVTVNDILLDDNDFMCMIDSTLYQLQNEVEIDHNDNCGNLLSTENLYDKCQKVIGPNALMACSSQTYIQTQPIKNFYETSFGSNAYSYEYSGYNGSYQYSYVYSNSMSYSFSMSYSYVNDDNVENNNVLDEFCHILDRLSSNEGQECLSAVCNVMGRTENSQPPSSVPTLLTTKMPSYEPSDQPTNPPSYLPTNLPSYLPTNPPSYLPTNTPSYLPTNPPSYLPSARPSVQPSSKPTIVIDEGKSTVAIKFEAGIVLNNIDDSDIPPPGPDLDVMVKVLTDVINKMLPSGAKARILKIGSVSLNRRILRFLQQGTNIQFEVIMTKICANNNCSDATSLADTMYKSVTEEIKVSVSNGSFSSSIQQEAASKGVTVLASVTVDENSFKATERTVQLDIIEVVQDDDTDDNNSVSIGAKTRSIQHTLIILLSAYFAANTILRI